jgi:hypothetical protein
MLLEIEELKYMINNMLNEILIRKVYASEKQTN